MAIIILRNNEIQDLNWPAIKIYIIVFTIGRKRGSVVETKHAIMHSAEDTRTSRKTLTWKTKKETGG